MHKLYKEHSHIRYMFLPKNSTSKLQACDLLYNACVKAKYKKSIARVLWNIPDDQKRVIKEGTATQYIMKAMAETSQEVCNKSFRMTGLKEFQDNQNQNHDRLDAALKLMVEEEQDEKDKFGTFESLVS